MNHRKLLWCCKTLIFMCLYTYGCLRWWILFIFSNNQNLMVLVSTMCCIKLFVKTFSACYGQITIKVQYDNIQITFLKLKGWFHVNNDFIIQTPLDSYIILVWSTLLKTWKTIIWDDILLHLVMLSFDAIWTFNSTFLPQNLFQIPWKPHKKYVVMKIATLRFFFVYTVPWKHLIGWISMGLKNNIYPKIMFIKWNWDPWSWPTTIWL
jgi:hypothetical protein